MSGQKIIDAYEAMAESYNRLIDHKPHNAYYDRPNTLSLVEDPQGKSILYAACGQACIICRLYVFARHETGLMPKSPH